MWTYTACICSHVFDMINRFMKSLVTLFAYKWFLCVKIQNHSHSLTQHHYKQDQPFHHFLWIGTEFCHDVRLCQFSLCWNFCGFHMVGCGASCRRWWFLNLLSPLLCTVPPSNSPSDQLVTVISEEVWSIDLNYDARIQQVILHRWTQPGFDQFNLASTPFRPSIWDRQGDDDFGYELEFRVQMAELTAHSHQAIQSPLGGCRRLTLMFATFHLILTPSSRLHFIGNYGLPGLEVIFQSLPFNQNFLFFLATLLRGEPFNTSGKMISNDVDFFGTMST